MSSLAGMGATLPRTAIAAGIGLTFIAVIGFGEGFTIEDARVFLAGEGSFEGLIWTLTVVFTAYVCGEIAITTGESWLPAIPKFTERPALGELLNLASKCEKGESISIVISEVRKFELFCGLSACSGVVVIQGVILAISGNVSLLFPSMMASLLFALLANLHARRAKSMLDGLSSP